MKKMLRTAMAVMMCLICCVSVMHFTATDSQAAETRKCYTINNGNTQVYSNTGLTVKYGTIYASDEITVSNVTSKYSKVTYKVTGTNRTKTGYVKTSAILTKTTGSTRYASAKITTYRRASTANTYGYVAKNDKVLVLGTKGSFTQIKYPVSGSGTYKYAFIKTSDAGKLKTSKTTSKPVTPAPATTSTMGQKVANKALSRVGQSYPNGRCEAFIEEVYSSCGVNRVYICCASSNANKYLKSTSMSNIPIGSTVYFNYCGGGPCRTCGSSYYGHVGIYVGDGYFVHATGGKVQKTSLSSWKSKYRGYGNYNNFK